MPPREFKAEVVNGKLTVQAIREEVIDELGNPHVTMHVPNLALINKLKREHARNNGKRNL